LPKHLIEERTFAWLVRHRRYRRNYKKTTATSEELTDHAMISLMTKRLANYETDFQNTF